MSKDCTKWSSFSDDRRQLTIHNLNTFYPWCNHIYTRDGLMYAVIDQRGGGNIFYNYEQNTVAKGFDFFLTEDNHCFSLNSNAVPTAAANCSCVMNPGNSSYQASDSDLDTRLDFTVAPGRYHAVWKVTVRNHRNSARRLALTAIVHTIIEGEENTQQLDSSWFDDKCRAIIMRRYHSECAPNRYSCFFAATEKPSSWCGTNLDLVNGYPSLAEAMASYAADAPLANVGACALLDSTTALRLNLELPANGEKTFGFILGLCNNETESTAEASQFNTLDYVESVFADNQKFYAELLQGSNITLPDEYLDSAVNCWTRLQLLHQNLSGRASTTYNWRNNLQDAMGVLHLAPEICRKRLCQMAVYTQPDGFVPRTTPKGEDAYASMQKYLSQRHNDIGCWYALAMAKYLKETGDFTVLQEVVDNPKRGKITVEDAVTGGLVWILSNRGSHGLVLFKDGDWSDPLEKAGRKGIGESVWTSLAAIYAINELAPILQATGSQAAAQRLIDGAADLAQAVERHAWDGKWYIRGITDGNRKFCTDATPDAKISMLIQAWAVFAGVGQQEHRLDTAVQELLTRCLTEFGPVLYDPPFMNEYDDIGRESAKRPGCCENGSCYTHGAMMFAAAMLKYGKADDALQAIKRVMYPMVPELYARRGGGPLWWSNYLQSPYANFPGRSSDIISSGAPAWFTMNLLEGFCGVQPQLDGLHLQPNFPSDWNEASLERTWRGATYHITIKRTGNAKVTLDGQEIPSHILPIPTTPGEKHQVAIEIV